MNFFFKFIYILITVEYLISFICYVVFSNFARVPSTTLLIPQFSMNDSNL